MTFPRIAVGRCPPQLASLPASLRGRATSPLEGLSPLDVVGRIGESPLEESPVQGEASLMQDDLQSRRIRDRGFTR